MVATGRTRARAPLGARRAGARPVRRVSAACVEVARAPVPIALETTGARLKVAQRPAARVVALRAVALLTATVGQGVGAPRPVPVVDVAAAQSSALVPQVPAVVRAGTAQAMVAAPRPASRTTAAHALDEAAPAAHVAAGRVARVARLRPV